MSDFTQLSFGDYVPTRERPYDYDGDVDTRTLAEKYEDWRQTKNGQVVYAAVVVRALRLQRAGWERYGIGAICEAVRYAHSVRVGPDDEGFKLNNNYRSRMAREIEDEYPELRGFFPKRRLTA